LIALQRLLLNQLWLAINQEKIPVSHESVDRLAIKVCFPWQEIQIPFHALFPKGKK